MGSSFNKSIKHQFCTYLKQEIKEKRPKLEIGTEKSQNQRST